MGRLAVVLLERQAEVSLIPSTYGRCGVLLAPVMLIDQFTSAWHSLLFDKQVMFAFLFLSGPCFSSSEFALVKFELVDEERLIF